MCRSDMQGQRASYGDESWAVRHAGRPSPEAHLHLRVSPQRTLPARIFVSPQRPSSASLGAHIQRFPHLSANCEMRPIVVSPWFGRFSTAETYHI